MLFLLLFFLLFARDWLRFHWALRSMRQDRLAGILKWKSTKQDIKGNDQLQTVTTRLRLIGSLSTFIPPTIAGPSNRTASKRCAHFVHLDIQMPAMYFFRWSCEWKNWQAQIFEKQLKRKNYIMKKKALKTKKRKNTGECEDTGCCPEDLPRAMNDREEWRERVRDIRATSAIWWWWWWWYIYIYILNLFMTVRTFTIIIIIIMSY